MADQHVSEPHTEYRTAATKVPYQGPDRPNEKTRTRRIIVGVALFVAVGVMATIFAWMRSVH